jgi:hypothetical protein
MMPVTYPPPPYSELIHRYLTPERAGLSEGNEFAACDTAIRSERRIRFIASIPGDSYCLILLSAASKISTNRLKNRSICMSAKDIKDLRKFLKPFPDDVQDRAFGRNEPSFRQTFPVRKCLMK